MTTPWNPTPPAQTATGAAGGDLAGTFPNPTVDGLQGQPVASATPATGQTLAWNGSAWTPSAPPIPAGLVTYAGGASMPAGSWTGAQWITRATLSVTLASAGSIMAVGRVQLVLPANGAFIHTININNSRYDGGGGVGSGTCGTTNVAIAALPAGTYTITDQIYGPAGNWTINEGRLDVFVLAPATGLQSVDVPDSDDGSVTDGSSTDGSDASGSDGTDAGTADSDPGTPDASA